jgi:hypothetical protein
LFRLKLAQQIRELRDMGRDPPRLFYLGKLNQSPDLR